MASLLRKAHHTVTAMEQHVVRNVEMQKLMEQDHQQQTLKTVPILFRHQDARTTKLLYVINEARRMGQESLAVLRTLVSHLQLLLFSSLGRKIMEPTATSLYYLLSRGQPLLQRLSSCFEVLHLDI